jgi:aspartate-semialdehyde dehydrogenase
VRAAANETEDYSKLCLRLASLTLPLRASLLADVPDNALIMSEETFAPAAAVTPFGTEDEVVSRANATEYGLVAYVATENAARALRLGRSLQHGMVGVNRAKITGAPVPFGGSNVPASVGRVLATGSAFTDLKYLCLDVS